jgi:hypothetical protein
MTWTTVPKWLYQNDLPAARLQAVYVEQAERKWRECAALRDALEVEIRDLRALKRGELTATAWATRARELGDRYAELEDALRAEQRALAFLEEARRRLAHYRSRRRG